MKEPAVPGEVLFLHWFKSHFRTFKNISWERNMLHSASEVKGITISFYMGVGKITKSEVPSTSRSIPIWHESLIFHSVMWKTTQKLQKGKPHIPLNRPERACWIIKSVLGGKKTFRVLKQTWRNALITLAKGGGADDRIYT